MPESAEIKSIPIIQTQYQLRQTIQITRLVIDGHLYVGVLVLDEPAHPQDGFFFGAFDVELDQGLHAIGHRQIVEGEDFPKSQLLTL